MTRALRKALMASAAVVLLGIAAAPGAQASCLWDGHSWGCAPLPASMASAVRPQPKAGAVLSMAFRLTVNGMSR